MGAQVMYYTPQSVDEIQPKMIHSLVVTADSRLDNRDELCALLDIPFPDRERISDSDLIREAYSRWGEACPAYLLGDFAFAIWDRDRRLIFCARDHIGIRPFYYHLTEKLFIFASDVQGVIAHPAVPCTLNRDALAMYLRDISFADKEMTFFEAVRKLPPAHSMTISSEGICLHRYWHPADSPSVRLRSIDEYAECLRELLQQAVGCRLRTPYLAGAHLSGGLDSSTIAVLAARVLRERGQTLFTYNWIHLPQEGEDPNAPEFAFSRAVCEQEGILHENIELTVEDVLNGLSSDIQRFYDGNFWYEPRVRKAAQARGLRVLLSGWGGDELVSFNGRGYYAELFWRGDWLKLARAIHWRGMLGAGKNPIKTIRRWFANLYYKVLLPSLPDPLYMRIDKDWLSPKFIDCAAPEFAAHIRQNLLQPQSEVRERVGLHPNQIALLENGFLTQRIEAWASNGAQNQILYTYPLLDQRIVEFSLGIPSELYVRDGYARYLFRLATGGILPDLVRWGSVKVEPRRVARLFECEIRAARTWLALAEEKGWLALPNPYIDTRAFVKLSPKGDSEGELLIYSSTLIQSIQVLFASLQLPPGMRS